MGEFKLNIMSWKASVKFLGEWAHYTINPDDYGIYHAQLQNYEGPDGVTPPNSVILVRSARNWVGSYSEPYFVQELGHAIEERVREGDPAGSAKIESLDNNAL